VAKLIIVMADLQVPYHDPAYVKVMRRFVRDMRQSGRFHRVELGQIGDLMDQPEVGRWNKGAAGEYSGTFWSGVRATREILRTFDFDWIKVGNHDRRVEDYITKYAPALGGDESEWNLNTLLGLDDRVLRRDPFQMAPGWIACHGDEGGLSPVSGRTAFGLALTYDQSVVCGHTHRAGVVSKTVGLPGSRRRIAGMEIGNGMQEEYATYIKTKSPNWQKGFGLFVVRGQNTYDQLVLMNPDCSFTYDGRVYRP
jgi:hypothetical protein